MRSAVSAPLRLRVTLHGMRHFKSLFQQFLGFLHLRVFSPRNLSDTRKNKELNKTFESIMAVNLPYVSSYEM